MKFSIDEINNVLGFIFWNGSLENCFNFSKVSIDSRTIFSDDLFIAIKGEKFDGHDFLKDVFKKGIKAVVVIKGKEHLVPKNCPFWVVNDTHEAFLQLALFKRKKLNIPVVAITGSVGKTTTKEISAEVLKKYGKIKVSQRNNNNEIGVGLTIHSCLGSEDLIVLEMGMRGSGQIEILSKYSEPDIAVITNIGCSHIGILGSRNAIAKAKCEITRHLNPKGVVIIPHGDPLLEKNLKQVWSGKVVRVKLEKGFRDKKNFSSKNKYLNGIYYSSNNLIEVDNQFFEISFKGIHNASNFLYVYAISKELGIKFSRNNKFNFRILEGRNNIINTNKLTILDESYNASPESVKACIELLLNYPGKHFLVLSSMKELGDKTIKYHNEIFKIINNSDIQKCIFICENDLEVNLKKSCYFLKNILFTNEIKSIAPIINEITSKGDYLLIKGSRYWQLEKLIPLID